jgi:predicted HTH transcriptional regulator
VTEKDEIQIRLGNIARDSCEPSVIISFKSFEIGSDQERCLLAVRINEIERKPCMSQGRIFIRDNATAVPANSNQVRRLLFGNLK